MGFCNRSMFCCVLLCVHSSFAIISTGKRELVALLCLFSISLMIVVWLFLTMPNGCLQFVIVVFPDHTRLLFLYIILNHIYIRVQVFLSTFSVWIICVVSVLFLLCFSARLFVDALWSPAGRGLTSWLLFVMSDCDVVAFPVVSWVRCGS